MAIYIITGIFALLLMVMLYVCVMQYKRANKYKKLYNDLFDQYEEIDSSVKSVLMTFEDIDNSKAFESDDEVGAIFDAFRDILKKHFGTKSDEINE